MTRECPECPLRARARDELDKECSSPVSVQPLVGGCVQIVPCVREIESIFFPPPLYLRNQTRLPMCSHAQGTVGTRREGPEALRGRSVRYPKRITFPDGDDRGLRRARNVIHSHTPPVVRLGDRRCVAPERVAA
jgi:hypothetical protein